MSRQWVPFENDEQPVKRRHDGCLYSIAGLIGVLVVVFTIFVAARHVQ